MTTKNTPASPRRANATFSLDRETAFQLFASFCGDVSKTAHSLGVEAADLQRMVDKEGWAKKIKGLTALRKSARPGDVERAINRALNYTQAHRLRRVLERAVTRLYNMSEKELDDVMLPETAREKPRTTDGPRRLVTRSFADLATALEKVHDLTYLALGDTVPDRSRSAAPGQSGEVIIDIHSQIARALVEVNDSTSPRALLFDSQLAQAELFAGLEPPSYSLPSTTP